ncbi:GPI mannosyltransferase 4-like [Teleopsis dalmanni]|uniref:GPI mannosyltransferase 4-like n=1 Tax=Teleopsis dalmanni TaxID=139649 RepID=UPI0018CD6856|nr:GPI mannosyltransferase 4-like [Teleopsis dalmanni]
MKLHTEKQKNDEIKKHSKIKHTSARARITNQINQFWSRHRNADENWYTYLFFAVLRFVLVFIPQLGYVHPDEFFQSVEVIAGDHFQLEHTRTWEFNNTLPVRSITLPFLLLRVPWSFYEFIATVLQNATHIKLLHSYIYLVFPRLIMCCLSFINDWSLYHVCRLYGLRCEIRLLALGSSWVMLVFGTRTFSNTIEMMLCSLLLALVADSMITTNTIVYKKEYLEERYINAVSIGEKVRIWKLKTTLPTHNYKYMLLLSTICVVGVFNRPTFLLFGAPMVFYWLLRGMGTKTITFTDFNLRILLFCVSALPTILVFIFFDSIYYKYLTAGELQIFDIGINNFVFTPWNFIKYNLDPSKTAEHGLHPKYTHLLVNTPLLYNVLGIIALISFAHTMIRFFKAEYQGLPRAQSIVGLMLGAIFVPLFFLLLINHQEARFLIPLTFPIVLLHATKLLTGFCITYPFKEEHWILRQFYNRVLCTQASAKYLLKTWYIFNIALTVFFGFIHQAGVFPLAQHFEHAMQFKPSGEHLHLITSHMYDMPLSFVNIPSSRTLLFDRNTGRRYRRSKDFYLYEYGSLNLEKLLRKIKLSLSNCEFKRNSKQINYRLFLAIPTSLSDDFAYVVDKSNSSYLHFELQRIFYPHLSTEAFPSIFGRHICDVDPPEWSQDDLKGTCSIEPEPSLSFDYVTHQFSSFIHQFGLALYEIKLKSRSPLNVYKRGTITRSSK